MSVITPQLATGIALGLTLNNLADGAWAQGSEINAGTTFSGFYWPLAFTVVGSGAGNVGILEVWYHGQDATSIPSPAKTGLLIGSIRMSGTTSIYSSEIVAVPSYQYSRIDVFNDSGAALGSTGNSVANTRPVQVNAT